MAIKKRLAYLFLGFIITSASAEYRVYQYYIKPKTQNLNGETARLVTSTLDPISYAAYNGGSLSLEVNLLRTWQCFGNTSKKYLCSMSEGTELEEVKK